ncbi:MAG: DUF1801 domain-containing protein [Melioribacteraceae bacterium]|nr:DUF1801 domain-containing protein [Melioribacteraceae bacterium]
MGEPKTKRTSESVEDFLNKIKDEKTRKDCFKISSVMKTVTKKEPKMWGDSIVGFGLYHYKSKSSQEGDWFVTGFSPRVGKISVYTMCYLENQMDLLTNLGKFKNSKSCIYIKSIDDIDVNILKQLIKRSIEHVKKTYGKISD